uniref:Ferritin n=1 Tax=Carukia barnesi TaxID=168717 RepID=D1FNZ5_CARBN|nr:ferritin [Carukia barnesi]
MSLARQNYHEECEAGVNKQINLELFASYVYMSMAYHFDRDDVDLKGFFKFFKKSSDEEREHAEMLMTFQNKRGGRIVLQDVKAPGQNTWKDGLEAMKAALDLEKHVNQSLLDLHGIATKHEDAQMTDYLEGHFLAHQVDSIKELAGYVANLTRVGPGLGEFQFDKLTLND